MSPEEKRLRVVLAENVRRLREEEGLTQEQAAERAGVDPRTWQRIESGETATEMDTIGSVAAALDVDPPLLFALRRPRR
jgi:transcriptional regulator with XRE-family HTH domain